MDPLNDHVIESEDEAGPDDTRVGSLVDGRYRILGSMASGSMGMVYKAERVPVGKLVALKFLHKSFAKDGEFLSRFERETRVMSRLAHPNCVSVLDFGVWKDSPYLVMEFVGGTTLRTLLDDKGALPPHRALGLARQMLAGLAHAHEQDVIHRDIKPANIMITEEIGTGDHVRILDFGLARLRGAVGRDATQSNVVVGTPNYMAPEQTVGGGVIDARTDVYAVGVVLFEMLAGERPFQAEDTLALLGMHRGAPIPKLTDKISDGTVMPDGIQKVIETAMAKSPSDRYQSAIEFAAAIDEVAGGRADSHRSVPTRTAEEAAVASTVLHINTSKVRQAVKPNSSRVGIVLLLLAGIAIAGVWYVKIRPSNTSGTPASKPVAAGASVDATTPPVGSGSAVVAIADSAVPADSDVGATDAAVDATIDPAIDPAMAGSGDLAGSGHAGSDLGLPGEPDAGAGLDEEIEMDPETAENPDPTAEHVPEAEEEAEDAPATEADAAKRVPAPAPIVLAKTVKDAVALIKAGKRDTAIASLRALQKKNPKSGYIPFLLGNLYNDKLWWSVAMDFYRTAISKSKAYRNNSVINKNVIKMLASKKTYGKAVYFLRVTIGRPALPYLRHAAQHAPSSNVRKRAASVAKQIR